MHSDGSSAESYRYQPFGKEALFDNQGNNIDQALASWRYSSKRKDAEWDLLYFGRRYYDPEAGRWLTPDPIGFADGMNLYVFNHNNPLRYIDGATFDGQGKFTGRTDVTDHGRGDHFNPHYHPATGPNSANSPPQEILKFN